jgi:hypothetical protein
MKESRIQITPLFRTNVITLYANGAGSAIIDDVIEQPAACESMRDSSCNLGFMRYKPHF